MSYLKLAMVIGFFPAFRVTRARYALYRARRALERELRRFR